MSHHSCLGRTVPSTPTSRFVPLHLIKWPSSLLTTCRQFRHLTRRLADTEGRWCLPSLLPRNWTIYTVHCQGLTHGIYRYFTLEKSRLFILSLGSIRSSTSEGENFSAKLKWQLDSLICLKGVQCSPPHYVVPNRTEGGGGSHSLVGVEVHEVQTDFYQLVNLGLEF